MCSCVASAQDYPSKPIRMIIPLPGGVADTVGRMIAQGISPALGQSIVADGRTAMQACETVARATPDGYTLLFLGPPVWILPLLFTTKYDPVKDFAPVTLAVTTPNVIVVHPSLPVNSVAELIALARARPGELNYSSSTTGGTNHLAPELFKAMTGVNITRIPYKSTGAAVNDLIGGRVQMMITNVDSVMPHVKAGRLRALAVATLQPSPLTPGLPTAAASGLPGYESTSQNALFAPAGSSKIIITRLHDETVRFLTRSEIRERLANLGMDVVASSPEELGATVKSETAKWGKVIKERGIRPE